MDFSSIIILCEKENIPDEVAALSEKTGAAITQDASEAEKAPILLRVTENGLQLEGGGQVLKCDLSQMLRRLKRENLSKELLVRVSKIKNAVGTPTAVDATAGLGEDSLMLAAAGFNVKLYERNPFIAALLKDAVRRAAKSSGLEEVISRMEVFEADSIEALRHLPERPDVVFLDPMFPEKDKTALAKKKFQILHRLEMPCKDEKELLDAAVSAMPHKIVIKRPLKGPYLCDKKPSFSLNGKAIRYDCIVLTNDGQ